MKPGTMHIYKKTDQLIYKITFHAYESQPMPRFDEKLIRSLWVNDIPHWQEYLSDNFTNLGHDYWKIKNYRKLANYIDKQLVRKSLVKRFIELPGLIKFLLIGSLLIIATTTYLPIPNKQSVERTQSK